MGPLGIELGPHPRLAGFFVRQCSHEIPQLLFSHSAQIPQIRHLRVEFGKAH